MLATLTIVIASLLSAANAFDRADEDCEACGLVYWRMQTIVAEKEAALGAVKAAKEKRAKKSTKAHNKRWLRQEYATELSGAIESHIEKLPTDQRIIGGACRYDGSALPNSALRAAGTEKVFNPSRCNDAVKKRISSVIGDFQDDLTNAAVSGKNGAGAACAAVIEGCSAERASYMLGTGYKESGMSLQQLDRLQVGYSDKWTLHEDVDGSIYWFSHSKMESRKEPPPGWVKGEDGKWRDGAAGGAAPKVQNTAGEKRAQRKDEL